MGACNDHRGFANRRPRTESWRHRLGYCVPAPSADMAVPHIDIEALPDAAFAKLLQVLSEMHLDAD
ncbi:MAG: hypothetical protein JWM34_4867 [Ilumatobacteraceae bacterium]|nr:hypothetical protein [Ilumatobacteraceae bacterium]